MKKLLFTLLFVSVLVFSHAAYAFDVKLAWDPSPSGDIKEYIVYYDTISGTPKGNSMNVGIVFEAVILSLSEGTTYYFHVTCKDWEGRESGPSNEVRTDGIVTPDAGQDPMAPGGCYIITIMP